MVEIGKPIGVGVYPTPVIDNERGEKFRVIRLVMLNIPIEMPATDEIKLGHGRAFKITNRFDLAEVALWETD